MAALPVIATDIRGCREEVVHGETGWLVPTRDSEALATSMMDAMKDMDKSAQMGRAGRTRVEEHFEESMTVERQWVEYERLMKKKNLT